MREGRSCKPFHSHPAHPAPVHRHNTPVMLHVTVCVMDRRPLLANDAAHMAIVEGWKNATHWRVGRYLIMPDHVHFFCAPGIHEAPSIRRWAGYWKRMLGELAPELKRIFQEDCWDTQMRSPDHYEEKRHYMSQNPVRKGLVQHGKDWPYQGDLGPIVW